MILLVVSERRMDTTRSYRGLFATYGEAILRIVAWTAGSTVNETDVRAAFTNQYSQMGPLFPTG